MSDLDPAPHEHEVLATAASRPELRLIAPRDVPLGGVRAMTVSRTLPERSLSTVGAWCFLDEAGPASHLTRVLPHPHIGLQTVSWLLEGSIRHRDTVGSSVLVRPGQLNLMTSGVGIAHSEFTPGEDAEPVHLLQLWIALPEHARHGAPHFEQHVELPVLERDGWSATVLLGELDGAVSPATTYTPLVGAEVRLQPGTTAVLPVHAGFEHAVLVPRGTVVVDGVELGRGPLAYLGSERTVVEISAGESGATVLLIGGEPLAEDLVMWWNFVGRTHDEIAGYREEWQERAERFGSVDGWGSAEWIPAPPLPNSRLKPRKRPQR